TYCLYSDTGHVLSGDSVPGARPSWSIGHLGIRSGRRMFRLHLRLNYRGGFGDERYTQTRDGDWSRHHDAHFGLHRPHDLYPLWRWFLIYDYRNHREGRHWIHRTFE